MTSVPESYVLVLTMALFCIGLLVILTKKSAIFVLMGIELMLNSAHINLALFSRNDPHFGGEIFAVFSIVLAAGEVVIALAILLNIYRKFGTTNLDDLTNLKH